MKHLLENLFLAFIWLILTMKFEISNFIFGFVVGYIVLWFVNRKNTSEYRYSFLPRPRGMKGLKDIFFLFMTKTGTLFLSGKARGRFPAVLSGTGQLPGGHYPGRFRKVIIQRNSISSI